MFGYSSNIDWDTFSDQEKAVIEALPHGSGIDGDWYCERQQNGKVVCYNSYHVMDEWGSYRAWADFSIRFTSDAPQDFRLMFHGKRSQYLNQHYQLRDYMEDTIYCAMESEHVCTID